jgi:hypothetical protein
VADEFMKYYPNAHGRKLTRSQLFQEKRYEWTCRRAAGMFEFELELEFEFELELELEFEFELELE